MEKLLFQRGAQYDIIKISSNHDVLVQAMNDLITDGVNPYALHITKTDNIHLQVDYLEQL